jgi:hypothetical protein
MTKLPAPNPDLTTKSLRRPDGSFQTTAHNTAPDSENKIHDDRVARTYGFRGGLVPGVTVYGYMIPSVLERFGHDWLERGAMTLRLHAPCYEGEPVVTRCTESTATAEHEDGSLYASGAVTLGGRAERVAVSAPFRPLPKEYERPIASHESLVPGQMLGSIRQPLDVTGEFAIPERLLRMANEILMQNFRMGPWIHAGSEIRHLRLAACGQEITISGLIQECFERKGRNFAVAALEMSANNDAGEPLLIAMVRHTFIFGLQKA